MQASIAVAIVVLAAIYVVWRVCKLRRAIREGQSPCAHCLTSGGCCKARKSVEPRSDLVPIKVSAKCGCSGLGKAEKTAAF